MGNGKFTQTSPIGGGGGGGGGFTPTAWVLSEVVLRLVGGGDTSGSFSITHSDKKEYAFGMHGVIGGGASALGTTALVHALVARPITFGMTAGSSHAFAFTDSANAGFGEIEVGIEPGEFPAAFLPAGVLLGPTGAAGVVVGGSGISSTISFNHDPTGTGTEFIWDYQDSGAGNDIYFAVIERQVMA